MDAIELLAREDEFKRLNKQLQKKTDSLMKEIEHVMQKQDFFNEFSPSLSLPNRQAFKKHCCTPPSMPDTPVKKTFKKRIKKLESPKSLETDESEYETTTPEDMKESDSEINKCLNLQNHTPNKKDQISELNTQIHNKSRRNSEFDNRKLVKRKSEKENKVICDCCTQNKNSISNEMEFLYAFVNLNVKDKVLPATFTKEDRVTVEGVCKFLSSKIKLMQEQIDKLQATIEKKSSQCESHLTQLAELESERMSLLNRTNNMKCSTADMRAKYAAMQKRLEEKEKLYKDVRSEADKQSSELKRLRSKNASVEAKCATLEQTIDTLRQQLEICKRSEKEIRDSTRQLSSTYDSAISRLEQQISSLTTRSEKQTALIRNLRKQTALLATEAAVEAVNKEYSGFLNQDF